eukprot:6936419-Pyramimonas_sp.AAC.1
MDSYYSQRGSRHLTSATRDPHARTITHEGQAEGLYSRGSTAPSKAEGLALRSGETPKGGRLRWRCTLMTRCWPRSAGTLSKGIST